MQTWPLQSGCDVFYGNPRGKNAHANPVWEKNNLVWVPLPVGFGMTFDGRPVTRVRVHKKIAVPVKSSFTSLWLTSGQNPNVLKAWGISNYSGGYEYRLMRESNHLSMHAYGIALDFDGANRPLHSKKFFAPKVVKCFTDQGAVNLSNDPMHFQWARVG